jgi:hypothetical protein
MNLRRGPNRRGIIATLALLTCALCLAPGVSRSEEADQDPGQTVPGGPIPVQPPPASGIGRWFNPATAPFIPVPVIAVDPDSGTTLGLLPTWVKSNDQNQISRIIAPDIIHNPYFGWGLHGRLYAYDSADEQWSVIAGIKERVERNVELQFEDGRLRDQRWSFTLNTIFERSGTGRFYGLGNASRTSAQSNYTDEREMVQPQVGFNLNRAWQILYTARLQVIDVLPGTLPQLPSTQTSFPDLVGLHTNKEFLNRLSVVYDTRDDLTVPTRGMKWVVYSGMASRDGLFNNSLYSEAGVDGRLFWPIAADSVLAAHGSLRYMPTANDVPFWALSNLGGGQSEIGGPQQLRGFGNGRYYDRDAMSASLEFRRKIFSFNAETTDVDIEIAPFIDVGRVFSQASSFPIDHVHQVYGVGFRGIARPFVVGYVDVGIGSDGAAVFTGLNYPF